ncbi:MAG TPA: Npt1/Npt2 family nucleotide transporter [Terriglobia bacterium]|nr:Npt1/Npt2 family nucleotide transporter [Terriglobia bacterium]
MIPYLERVLNVRRGEFTPASLLFLYLFLALFCYIMGQSVGDAMFLSAFPTYLPHVIISTALAVGIFTSIYIRLSRRVRLELLIIGSLLFFASSFTLFWWLAHLVGKWAYPFIYIWVYMTGALAPAMGWTLANYALTTREARRVFGFIGAGASLGAPCAGFLTADLTRHAHMRPEALLLVIAAGLGLCGLSVRLLFRQAHRRLAGFSQAPGAEPDMPKNLRQVWAYIRGSRYLLLITALIMIGCASTTIISYQFRLIAYSSFRGNKAALATFFGRFNGYMGLASFILQMLLTGQLLRSLGIRVTLFVMPTVFLGGSVGVLLAPVLLSACILKGSQGLLRYSLDKSSTELLYLPVAPPKMKSQIKSFIDGFVWRMADGLAGVALFLFGNRMRLGPGRISLVNFAFLSGWIAIAYGVRREYLRVLRWAIERRTLDPERTAAGVLDSTTTEVLAQALERGGEQQVLYGLSLFEVGREPAWHPALRGLLEHPSADVRQRALHLLADAGQRDVLPQVEKMLADESVEVRAEALQYVVVHTGRDPLDLLKTATDVPAHCLQSAVVIYLAGIQDPNYSAAAPLILQTMLSAAGPEGVDSRREAARALGTIPTPSELHPELFKLLRDQDAGVVEQALVSAGRIRGSEFLPLVVEKLAQPRLLGAARAALAQYGDQAVGTLQDRLNDPSVPIAVRKQIPGVLARIATRRCAAVLTDSIVQSDPELRYEVIKALNKLRTRDPVLLPSAIHIADMLDSELIGYYRSFQILAALDQQGDGLPRSPESETLVASALRERMGQEFERLFRLLGLLYPPRDIHNAYVGLLSERPQLRANSLEVLEHLLAPDLYRRLAAGVDPESTPAERLDFARRLCRTGVNSRVEALRILLHSEDGWLRTCAVYAIGQGRLAELSDDLSLVPHESDPVLGGTWEWATARLAAVETAKGARMLTILEKVDLLRKALMFRDIPTPGLARVAAISNEVTFAPNQILYEEDSPADSMFFMLEGEVELARSDRKTQIDGQGPLLGGLAVLAGEIHAERAIATQPTRILQIDRQDLLDAMAEDFSVTRGVLKALASMAAGAS